MELVDAHCHLDGRHFREGPDAVIDRALAQGVVGFIVVGLAGEEGEASADAVAPARFAVDLARRLPERVAACVGLHPHDARTWSERLEESLRALCSASEVVAVGEVGLDYHYDHSPRDVQRDVFARFVHVARSIHKPLVVHTRSAPEDTLTILDREGARDVGGIIHCFSEDRAFARRALDLGFSLSFSGIVTFKNATAVRDVAAWAPVDSLLVETDSPYLAPAPLRGKRCEPAYVAHTLRHLAQLRGLPPEDLAVATRANTEKRFGRPLGRAGVAVASAAGRGP